MSKRYLQWGYDSFKDTKTGEISDNYIHLLNKQAERIEELEEQLKNAIVPKFKVGDKVYAIIDTFAYTDVLPIEIRDTHLLYEVWDGQDTTKQHYTRIFATKEEAQAKLQELQGE
jgi:hypothetical protein